MDSVRFGRALGVGARAAAKTLVTAVDAAAAPNPSAASGKTGSAPPAANGGVKPVEAATKSQAADAGVRLGQEAARKTAQVAETGRGLRRGSRRFGEAVWGPFVKLSGVLWLEVTGTFFGIFAAFAAGGAWNMRAAMRETAANQREHEGFVWGIVMALVFGYFCVSSFVSAHRRGKNR
jgi:hypothetical protein